MIIQKQKSYEDILKMLDGVDSVFVVGCSECATVCKTGGLEEVAAMKDKLTESGKTVTGTVVYDPCCNINDLRRRKKELAEAIDSADAVLVLACGTGVQSVGDFYTDKVALPGCDSLFVGEVSRVGRFAEKCSVCGECVLDEYCGICPMTRCAKRLLNGPCGGSMDGKCEANPEQDCAWDLIFERLRSRGKLESFLAAHAPKDFAKASSPRRYEIERPSAKKD